MAREAQRAAAEREAQRKHHDAMSREIARQAQQDEARRAANSKNGSGSGCLGLLLLGSAAALALPGAGLALLI